tara:strand:+ start:5899 stop:6693 length:795 start_codon:yes stop_codon:yes gene_type:complete
MFEILSSIDAWVALLTLIFLEIVLGIDNIIFISISANKLDTNQRKSATNIGLLLAMLMRIILLFGIGYLTSLNKAFWSVETSWITGKVSGQALILFIGGIFLLYKSTKEIREKVEHSSLVEKEAASTNKNTFTSAIVQITIINVVFSLDSILTAIGMTNNISEDPNDALLLMIIAVILSVLIMMLFANPVGAFVSKHPSIQILGLSFLLLIGFMLITEAAHLSHLIVFKQEIGSVPKGYLYFAICFSLLVEFLDMRMKRNKNNL